jgi:hypothetical protein
MIDRPDSSCIIPKSGGEKMTKYQILIAGLLVVSILSALLEGMSGSNKGVMYQLHRIFAALTLLAVLLLGYRAFFLIR